MQPRCGEDLVLRHILSPIWLRGARCHQIFMDGLAHKLFKLETLQWNPLCTLILERYNFCSKVKSDMLDPLKCYTMLGTLSLDPVMSENMLVWGHGRWQSSMLKCRGNICDRFLFPRPPSFPLFKRQSFAFPISLIVFSGCKP